MNTELAIMLQRGEKRIKVNEAGEYITLNFDDQSFVPRLLNLMQEVEQMAEDGAAKEAEIAAMPTKTEKEHFAQLAAKADYDLQVCRVLMAKIDAAFADAVCRKVFGNIVPSVALIGEFFAQLKGVIIKLGEEREKNSPMWKYTEKYNK